MKKVSLVFLGLMAMMFSFQSFVENPSDEKEEVVLEVVNDNWENSAEVEMLLPATNWFLNSCVGPNGEPGTRCTYRTWTIGSVSCGPMKDPRYLYPCVYR